MSTRRIRVTPGRAVRSELLRPHGPGSVVPGATSRRPAQALPCESRMRRGASLRRRTRVGPRPPANLKAATPQCRRADHDNRPRGVPAASTNAPELPAHVLPPIEVAETGVGDPGGIAGAPGPTPEGKPPPACRRAWTALGRRSAAASSLRPQAAWPRRESRSTLTVGLRFKRRGQVRV